MWKVDEPGSDVMFVHKKSDGGVTFVGYNNSKHIYTTDYYANVGICNAAEPKKTTAKMIKTIIKRCLELNYTEVVRLKEIKRFC